MSVLPGDIVRHDGREWVVVDVTGGDGPMAVLRAEDDLELFHGLATLAADLVVIRHLEHLDGWVEDSPGIWSQV